MKREPAIVANLAATLVVATVFTLFPRDAVFAAGPDTEELYWLSKRYPKHIFDYCLDLHPYDPDLSKCLEGQRRIRKKILIDATDQLGNRADALSLYKECKEYYPSYGVVPIGECVAIGLNLHRKLEFDVIERFIYQKCDEKWSKHSFLAINNCAVNSANTYIRYGRLPEW